MAQKVTAETIVQKLIFDHFNCKFWYNKNSSTRKLVDPNIRRPEYSSTRIFVDRTFVDLINMAKIRRPALIRAYRPKPNLLPLKIGA
jgi:hypothetical protein